LEGTLDGKLTFHPVAFNNRDTQKNLGNWGDSFKIYRLRIYPKSDE
jgi:hypothetical protein